MDPEEMTRLLRAAQAASRQGAPMERINAEIESRTGGSFSDVESLAAAARDSGVSMDQLASPPEIQPRQVSPPESEGGGGVLGSVRGHLRNLEDMGMLAAEGITLGAADELAGGLAGAAAAIPGGRSPGEAFRETTDAHRERVEQARENLGPVIGTGAEIGGAIATGAAAGGLNLIRRGGGLLSRMGRGAGIGGAEGGAYGFASEEGDFEARSESALRGAAFGAGAGAAAPAAVPAFQAGRRGVQRATQKTGDVLGLTRVGRDTRKAEARVGRRVADEARDVSGVEGSPASVRNEIDESRRAIFGPLDDISEIDHPGLQQRLQSDEIAPFVPEEVAQGARLPSFPEAHGSLRQLRRAKDAALRSGDAASFRELANAERKLAGDLADAVDGFEEASERYAGEMARSRALDEGADRIKNTHTAESFEEAFENLDTEAERQAFKESALAEYLSDLEDVTAIKSRLEKLQHGRRTRRKMSILMGGDDGLAQLEAVAREAERIRNRAKATRRLRRRLVELFAAGAGAGGVIEFFRE